MNEYKVYGKLENDNSYSYTVSCESETMARQVIFNYLANHNKSATVKLWVRSMYVTELEKVGA